jgi:putative SOS response-associated peptidase YedK
MCGRYLMNSPVEAMRNTFKVDARVGIPERYNIAPRQPVLIIRNSEEGVRELAAVEWGLVPEWKKEKGDKPLINARIETITEKPSFRSSIKRKRCLVPFNGWYEWKSVNGRKVPHLIQMQDGELGAFAGIWSTWHGPGGDFWLETMAIVTGESTDFLRPVHHRKPLVLKPEQYDSWLQPQDPLPRGFLTSFDWVPERSFEYRPVSSRVSSVRMEGPACIAPPEDEVQGSLF